MTPDSNEERKKIEEQEYQQLVEQVRPRPNILLNCIWAFIIGGLICTLGQLILDYFRAQGMSMEDAER